MPPETASKLDEALALLAEAAGESKEKKREVALRLLDNDATKDIGEVLLKKGLTKRTADATGQATELEKQLKEAKDELAEAKGLIRELESKEPNWQRRQEESDRKWQAKLDKAEGEARTERQVRLRDKVEIERQKFRAALRIGQDDGVDQVYGELLPAQYVDRFVPDEDSQTVKVRELGEASAFYDPAEGDPAEQLARDVLAKLPPKVRIMGPPEGGGGTQNGGPIDKATRQIVDQKRAAENYVL